MRWSGFSERNREVNILGGGWSWPLTLGQRTKKWLTVYPYTVSLCFLSYPKTPR